VSCRSFQQAAALLTALVLLASSPVSAGRPRPGGSVEHEVSGHLTFASPQSNPLAISPDGSRLLVANTAAGAVEVINLASPSLGGRVFVGMDPVAVAFRPDGNEAWIANHVSDSISVVDTNPASASFLRAIETIQDLDASGVSNFDEPVGIAFREDGSEAYVALSSRNEIAVVDTSTYEVIDRLSITAQDPRALTVRDEKLFVAAFESGNQTEISACFDLSDDTRPGQCTLDVSDLGTFAVNPNIPGADKNIVVDDDLPDRDLFVFDLNGDRTSPDVVEGIGTLLYGIAVDGTGTVFVTQTDARNDVNGLENPEQGGPNPSDVNGDGSINVVDLENRMFLNQVTEVDCSPSCGSPTRHDLEPLPPTNPSAGDQLATPYGVAIAENGSGVAQYLVITAAASSRVAILDAANPGTVLDRLDVGAIPRGVVLRDNGGTHTAYILNTLGNSITIVDVDDITRTFGTPSTLALGADPTDAAVRAGRIAFNDAGASDSGTFSCASCHPDGNTDQLLWRIGGECFLVGCVAGQDEARTTMPIRGLRDTLPLHWDGTLGDPFGGGNGAVGEGGSGGTDCDVGGADGQHDCFVDLVEASLSGVMCEQTGSCPPGGTLLSAQEIDDMAIFLERVSYPPARSRRPDDVLSTSSVRGFEDFFMDQGGLPQSAGAPDTCADSDAGCHELPLGTGSNSETLEGFDVPTMRGLTDRFAQFSLGVTGTEENLIASNVSRSVIAFGFQFNTPANPFPYDPAMGLDEASTFGSAFGIFNPVYNVLATDIFQMVEEASTGFSGALGRQVTLNTRTTDPVNPPGPAGPPLDDLEAILDDLETADERGLVNLRGRVVRNGVAGSISYDGVAQLYNVLYLRMSHAAVIAEAQTGGLLAHLTAQLRATVNDDVPKPLLSMPNVNCGTGTGATGDPLLRSFASGTEVGVTTKWVDTTTAVVYVDGQPWAGATVTAGSPILEECADSVATDEAVIDLVSLPGTGTHLLQLVTPDGLISNELPFDVP